MQIKQLESVPGQPLLEHMGKHIHPTQAGQEAVRVARAVEGELANLEQPVADLQGLTGGTLVVSAASTASMLAARVMAVFRARHPDVLLSLNVVNRETLLQHLARNDVDLALMGQPPDGLDLAAQPLWTIHWR